MELLTNLTEEQLDTYKESLNYNLNYKYDDIVQQNVQFLTEIIPMTYNFQRYELEAKGVYKVTKKQLMEFYIAYFQTDSKKKPSVFIHIIPADETLTNEHDEKAKT